MVYSNSICAEGLHEVGVHLALCSVAEWVGLAQLVGNTCGRFLACRNYGPDFCSIPLTFHLEPVLVKKYEPVTFS